MDRKNNTNIGVQVETTDREVRAKIKCNIQNEN